MPIRYGEVPFKAFSYGTKPVVAIYLGSERIWPETAASFEATALLTESGYSVRRGKASFIAQATLFAARAVDDFEATATLVETGFTVRRGAVSLVATTTFIDGGAGSDWSSDWSNDWGGDAHAAPSFNDDWSEDFG